MDLSILYSGNVVNSTSLLPITSHFLTNLQNGNYKLVDYYFSEIEVEKLNRLLLMSLLRTCFAYKLYLNNYNNFLDRCYKESLKRYGEKDAKRLLRGLIEKRN